ncbi:metallophosphoesterase family protein [Gimesia fumaroli]|jgi:predicted phosphodiesterase|uniref:Calcineurin-like phosphoesterase domain-containing protein n=1 Tax=Gimesia fumaroli TaxID=2527976 RepID=A0A518IEM5_9PLAN|nr:metallophosphoesterase [Gimesia fumaroli]QDV51543.1 hypothetical protein Enr17x_35990 [Gimesia fumaroli]
MQHFINILHLTDLHIGGERTDIARAQFNNAVDALYHCLESIKNEPRGEAANDDWRPQMIAISGDIAYSGSMEEFRDAGKLISRICQLFNLDSKSVVLCPGNHDRNTRRVSGITYPGSSHEADDWLAPENFVIDKKNDAAAPLSIPFQNFYRFCDSSKFLKPEGLSGLEYLTGVCQPSTQKGLDFIVLNSSWFCKPKGNDIRNLWLGLPLLEKMQSSRQITRTDVLTDHRIRIALVHHPKDWLNEEEHDTYSNRPNTFRYLAERCDIILSGHVHGALEPPTRSYDRALVFSGGASYAGHRFRNNFSIIQIDVDDLTVRRRGFEYDSRETVWIESERARGIYPLRKKSPPNTLFPNTKAIQLSGEWESDFWIEGANDLRKPSHRLQIEQKKQGKKISVTGKVKTGDEALRFSFDGFLKNGYITGTWEGQSRPSPRYGVFQLRVEENQQTLSGRWLGFNRDGTINVGKWKAVKINRTSKKKSSPS